MVMKGYYKNPVATDEAIRDGWLCSGDLGRTDSKGNLFVTGRKKEVIVLPNGKNIYPEELEAHYLGSPYIQEIAVIGVCGPGDKGERLHAVVVPNFEYLKAKKIANAREILHDQIADFSQQLPHYKRLMSYEIRGEPLPRTTTRKIKRLELKRLAEGGQQPQEGATRATLPEDAALMESAVGQEVLHCLREVHRRDGPIAAGMNLELDLGFDSMERVELVASLGQALNLQLPEDFGADLFTVRDLIVRLELEAGILVRAGSSARQSWKTILSEEALNHKADTVHLTGTAVAALKHLLLRLVYRLVFRPLLGLEIRGLEHLPARGPYLVCPNHQSYLDPFVLVSALPYRVFRNMFFVGYSVLFDNWFMKRMARLMHIVPVDPDAHLLRAMKAGAHGLRNGLILCIFPEGGRAFDGTLQEFKKGAAILARELLIPMIPVGIRGTYQVWPRSSARIRLHKVTVRFGAPLYPSRSDEPDPYQADTDRLRASVAELIGQ